MVLSRRGSLIAHGSEDEIQARFFRWVDENSGRHPVLSLIYAIPNGGLRSKKAAARLYLTGVKAGVPDVHLAMPAGGLPGLWIEFKRPKTGRMTPAQLRWQNALKQAGFKVVTHTSWVKAANEVIRYLDLPMKPVPPDPTEIDD